MQSGKFPIGIAAFVSLFTCGLTAPMAAETTPGDPVMTQHAHGQNNAKHPDAKPVQERRKHIEDRLKAMQQLKREHRSDLPEVSPEHKLLQGSASAPNTGGGAVGGPYIGFHFKRDE